MIKMSDIQVGQRYHWWDDGEPAIEILIVGKLPDGRAVAYHPSWLFLAGVIEEDELESMSLIEEDKKEEEK